MMDLGTLGGVFAVACCINNRGQVVGITAVLSEGILAFAFLWENGVVTNLEALPAHRTNSEALGINDRGMIFGMSEDANGRFAAVLWRRATPQEQT